MKNTKSGSLKVHPYSKEMPKPSIGIKHYKQENGLSFTIPSWILAHWYENDMIVKTVTSSGRIIYHLNDVLKAIKNETDGIILSRIIYYGYDIDWK